MWKIWIDEDAAASGQIVSDEAYEEMRDAGVVREGHGRVVGAEPHSLNGRGHRFFHRREQCASAEIEGCSGSGCQF